MKYKNILLVFALIALSLSSFAQAQGNGEKEDIVIDYNRPKTYIIGGITVSGVDYVSDRQVIALSGMNIGSKITVPSTELSGVVKRLWEQKFFSSIALKIDSLSINKDTAYFCFEFEERARVSRWQIVGVKNSEVKDLQEVLGLRRNTPISEYLISSSIKNIKDYYNEKGYTNANVNIVQKRDTMIRNAMQVTFSIDRGKKVKVKEIIFEGNTNVPDNKIISQMPTTRDMRFRNFLKSKKFNKEEFENDKQYMMQAFSEMGYRDAKLLKDSVYIMEEGRLGIKLKIDEGQQYYFRNITWTGNSLYTTEELNQILRIKKGDVYDIVTLNNRLNGDPRQMDADVRTLYTNKGYLFFNVMPVEVKIEKDSVDVEIRMMEGDPGVFNNIVVSGNTTTTEKVIRRQLYTKPGYLYNQTDLERSLREIASMGHFDPEHAFDHTKGYSILPNPTNNTVDVTYNVLERSNSKFEVSGGWGGYSFVLSVGLSFSNISVKNLFKKEAWTPVPLGDGQIWNISLQSNGQYYTAFSTSFTEPWLFGKKPISLNVTGYYSRNTNSDYLFQNTSQSMEIYGVALGLGKRLKWPDSYFTLYNELSWQNYNLNDWQYYFVYDTGRSTNLSYKIALNRNSTDQMIYPRSGSDFTFSVQLTPPYSLFRDPDTDYQSMPDGQRYKWIEYHKWTFKGTLYTKLIGDLVLMTRMQFGYLGYYNRNLGYSPFETYQLGGDGMSGYSTYGSEIVSLRGYPNASLTPEVNGVYQGHLYDKFTLELRYPILLQQGTQIYALAFLEAGNAWSDIKYFNPFSVKRSAGIGLRVNIPMLGLLGVDWGWGFDSVGTEKVSGSNFHFVIGQQF